jgi:hypothetical protein
MADEKIPYLKAIKNDLKELGSHGLVDIIDEWNSEFNVGRREYLRKIKDPITDVLSRTKSSYFAKIQGKKEGEMPDAFEFSAGKEDDQSQELLEHYILEGIRTSFGEKSKLYQALKEEGGTRAFAVEIFGAQFEQLANQIKMYNARGQLSQFIDNQLAGQIADYVIKNKVNEKGDGLEYGDFAKYNEAQTILIQNQLEHYDTVRERTAGIRPDHKFKAGTEMRDMLQAYENHLQGTLSDAELFKTQHMYEHASDPKKIIPYGKKPEEYDYANAA